MALPIEPIVEPVLEPITAPLLTLVPEAIPTQGEPTIFAGPSRVPSWDDVFGWAKDAWHGLGRPPYVDPHVSHDELDQAVEGAIGTTIKAMSGFINTLAQAITDAQSWASIQIDALNANLGWIYGYLEHRIANAEATNAAVTQLAIPNLQAQISQLRHDMGLGFEYNSAADRAWVTDNIFAPLYESMFHQAADFQAKLDTEKANRIADIDHHTNILQGAINALGATVLPQVASLTAESEECVKPMCETMGPNTDLGKLLKLIKWASLAALLAELAGLHATDIEGLVGKFGTELTSAMSMFQELFVDGGETIGHTLVDAAGRIV